MNISVEQGSSRERTCLSLHCNSVKNKTALAPIADFISEMCSPRLQTVCSLSNNKKANRGSVSEPAAAASARLVEISVLYNMSQHCLGAYFCANYCQWRLGRGGKLTIGFYLDMLQNSVSVTVLYSHEHNISWMNILKKKCIHCIVILIPASLLVFGIPYFYRAAERPLLVPKLHKVTIFSAYFAMTKTTLEACLLSRKTELYNDKPKGSIPPL